LNKFIDYFSIFSKSVVNWILKFISYIFTKFYPSIKLYTYNSNKFKFYLKKPFENKISNLKKKLLSYTNPLDTNLRVYPQNNNTRNIEELRRIRTRLQERYDTLRRNIHSLTDLLNRNNVKIYYTDYEFSLGLDLPAGILPGSELEESLLHNVQESDNYIRTTIQEITNLLKRGLELEISEEQVGVYLNIFIPQNHHILAQLEAINLQYDREFIHESND